jgi:hypothetical protein
MPLPTVRPWHVPFSLPGAGDPFPENRAIDGRLAPQGIRDPAMALTQLVQGLIGVKVGI